MPGAGQQLYDHLPAFRWVTSGGCSCCHLQCSTCRPGAGGVVTLRPPGNKMWLPRCLPSCRRSAAAEFSDTYKRISGGSVQLLEPGQTLTWATKGADGRGPLETAGRWEQSSFSRGAPCWCA
jgi:hypothetical protein